MGLLWETKIYQVILSFVDVERYVSIRYKFLLKSISENTLVQSYIPIITSSALEFQFLFEILNNMSYLSSIHKCYNGNIFVKTPYD